LILDTTYSTRTGKVKVTDFKRPIRASRELSMQLKNS
jgi:hypothetical protein